MAITLDTRTRIKTVNDALLNLWSELLELRGETGDGFSDAEISKAMKDIDSAQDHILRAAYPVENAKR